jgi:hypothetical protein
MIVGRGRVLLAFFVTGLATWVVPRSAHAFGSCRDPAYMASFASGVPAQSAECDVVDTMTIDWSGHHAPMRLVKLPGTTMSDQTRISHLARQLASSVGAAMGQLGDVSIWNVTIMFVNQPPPTDPTHVAHTWGREGECAVTFFKPQTTSDEESFVAIYAHELFHCIQYASWPRKMKTDYAQWSWWWREGAATYFAYLAVPGTTVGDQVVTGFDQHIASTSLVDMAYEPAVFFAWLGKAHGPAAVAQFHAGMAEQAGRDAQLAALRAQVSPDEWIEFAEAYEDQTITLPGGRSLPSHPPSRSTVTVTDGSRLAMPSTPFTIAGARLVFPRNHDFRVDFFDRPTDARTPWRGETSGGHWDGPPASLNTCSGEERRRALWITTQSSTAGEARFTTERPGVDPCSCPAGRWRETTDSLHHAFEQSFDANDHKKWLSGGRILQLDNDHTGSLTYDNVIVEIHSKGPAWSRTTLTGASHFTWKVYDGKLVALPNRGDALLNNHNEFHVEHRVNVTEQQVGAQSIGHIYRCDGDKLYLVTIVHLAGHDADMTFERAAPPAPPPPPNH